MSQFGWLDDDKPKRRPSNERRCESRHRVLFTGKIVYINTSVSTDCTIRDISACGARLSVTQGPVLDEPFLIVVRAALVHPSRVAWHLTPQVGLNFLETIRLGQEIPSQLEGIQRIWATLKRDHEDAQDAWRTIDQPRRPPIS
ncbi:MAG TPA: PilZ domain-containing protein [Caulobacteraceae bacterium]|jgi:hypothetical protein|nr:PilZ domain-containing protein [Caulobacteraceae bacterium]